MPHARPLSKTYYWIDYKEFCDVVRWRMDTLYKSLDKKLRTVSRTDVLRPSPPRTSSGPLLHDRLTDTLFWM